METVFDFADDLGPAKVVHLHHAGHGLRAIVVIDNVACGPSIGGVRIAPDVSLQECFRLARAMTLKNAAAGLPHGGGKSVIFADPSMDPTAKEALMRAFARAIRDLADYIPGPDMGTNETMMAYVMDEIGRSVGLPPEVGGIPLDEIGATGLGIMAAVDVACEVSELDLEGARIVVQGFGSVGKHAARFLSERGAVLVGASDSRGAVCDPDGIDIAQLIALKEAGGGVQDYAGGDKCDGDALLDVHCDVWIPAARPDVIRADNAHRVRARIVASGANIAVTDEAEAALHARGVISLPDFIANAGGVICASVEYHGGTAATALATIEARIRANVAQVLEASRREGQTPRAAAVALANERVQRAMTFRR